MLFDNLKEGFEKSVKEKVLDVNPVERPQRMVLITDGFDDIEDRVKHAEEISKSFDMELHKLYLHDFSHLLKNEEDAETSIVQAVREHSTVIRSLKDQKFTILLEEKLKSLLIESREIRQASNENIFEFDEEDINAVAQYLIQIHERKQNFLESIIEKVKEIKPQIVTWKPPTLETRGRTDVTPIRHFSSSLMRQLPKDTWVLFDGEKKINEVENIVMVVLGGQQHKEIIELAKSVPGIVSKITNQKLTFLVSIEESELELAQMAIDQKNIDNKEDYSESSEGKEVHIAKADEVESGPEDTEPVDELKINELIAKRYKSLIDPLRIEHHGATFELLIGDLHDLEVKLRELKAHLVLVANKESGGVHFDEEIVAISRAMIRNNITTLIV